MIGKLQTFYHLAQNGDEKRLRKPTYYFDVGVDDQLGFADDNAALSSVLAAREIPHTFSLRPGKHGASFIEANIEYGLGFMSQLYVRYLINHQQSNEPFFACIWFLWSFEHLLLVF